MAANGTYERGELSREALERTILGYLKRHYSGTMSTVRSDGTPQSSGITYVNLGFALYFGIDPESEKKKNVDRNPNVGMAIFKDYKRFDQTKAVQLAGRCEPVTDPAEQAQAGVALLEKFPGLMEYPGMMDWVNAVGPIPMYKITPWRIAYLDYPRYGFNRYQILDL